MNGSTKTVLISYDLNGVGKDYEDVTRYIKSLGHWAKPLRSQWLVKTDLRLMDIVTGLRLHGLDKDDSLLVVEVTRQHAAWYQLSPAVSDWIQSNL